MNELALFAGSGGGFSVESYLAGLRSARWSLNHTHAMSCSPDNETDCSRLSRSGMMSARLTANPGEDSSTSSAAASPARTSPAQEKAQALRESEAASGRKCTESFARFDRVSRSWKTAQCLLLGDLEPYSETWPRAGIMLHGSCSELTTWELPMSERESGFLHLIPTPTACNAPNAGSNTKGPKSLQEVAWTGWKPGQMWPTPVSHNAKELTACPSNLNRKTPGLGTLAAWGKLGTPGKLNPPWTEWLMGWPLGWTDLKPLAMDKYRSWLQQHSFIFTTY